VQVAAEINKESVLPSGAHHLWGRKIGKQIIAIQCDNRCIKPALWEHRGKTN
jgi:hypothetical protein